MGEAWVLTGHLPNSKFPSVILAFTVIPQAGWGCCHLLLTTERKQGPREVVTPGFVILLAPVESG